MRTRNEAGSFLTRLSPPVSKKTANKKLASLSFGVKSIIGVKGYPQQFGNKIWDEMNRKNRCESHAPCIKTLLRAGARLVGTLHTSEFAFDITGASVYGMPINPRVKNAMPGGSSSGSATAVANREIDFALGTDTGGSIRIPAAFCGVWSLRPTTGLISTDQVIPVGKRYDTIGVIAGSATVLNRVAGVLLPQEKSKINLKKIYVIKEALDLCPDNIKQIYENRIEQFKHLYSIIFISIGDIIQTKDKDFSQWQNTSKLLLLNTWETLSPWLEKNIPDWEDKDSPITAEVRDNLLAGKSIAALFCQNPSIKNELELQVDNYQSKINEFLSSESSFLIPTTPCSAPPVGTKIPNTDMMNIIALTSIASLAQLPQVQMPIVADEDNKPLGLSLIGKRHHDHVILNAAENIEFHLMHQSNLALLPLQTLQST